MPRICYNTRDELIIIDLNLTACIQASGNYSTVIFITGQQMTLTLGLSEMERLIALAHEQGTTSDFIRLGRSVIVNQRYLRHVDVLKQTLTLGDLEHKPIKLSIPKSLARGYKDHVAKLLHSKPRPNK